MPSDFSFKAANAMHKMVVAVSFGHLGWHAGRMPVLELTTTGRKSGQRRSVMLTSPVQDGDTYVVVASRGGDDRHPAWFLNLRENPDVEVTIHGKTRRAKAHIATAEERAALWPRVIAGHKNYGEYQRKTSREIPLVLLEPVADA